MNILKSVPLSLTIHQLYKKAVDFHQLLYYQLWKFLLPTLTVTVTTKQ